MKTVLRNIKAVYENVPGYAQINRKRFTGSHDVCTWFRDLQDETKEHFISLHLDSKNSLLCMDVVSIGSMNASIVHPREVFKTALLSSAVAIIFIHNHPSGDTTPSREDLDITNRLINAGEIIGIRVLDHIIIGIDGKYLSMADRGLI